jgi:hypothetical protein
MSWSNCTRVPPALRPFLCSLVDLNVSPKSRIHSLSQVGKRTVRKAAFVCFKVTFFLAE